MTKISGEQDLENTYKLASPADIVDYYRDFAPSYDTGFAQEMGWHYPKAIAVAYHKHARADDAPVADIGCGTGFVAAELKLDEKIAAHAEQAGELWATWSVSAQEGEKYAIAVEKITKSYLCEGLPVDLLPRCRAIMKKADELEIDSAARNMFEFMQLWEQGCREGLEAYKMRVGEWDLE